MSSDHLGCQKEVFLLLGEKKPSISKSAYDNVAGLLRYDNDQPLLLSGANDALKEFKKNLRNGHEQWMNCRSAEMKISSAHR